MKAIVSWSFLFGANFMWALQFTCVKLVQDQVGVFFTVWGPMTLATVFIYPFLRSEGQNSSRSADRGFRDIFLFLALAVLGVFPGQFFITWGTRLSLASNAAILMLALPVCTAVMARFFLRERMTTIRWVSFALALAGVLMCSNIELTRLDFGSGYLIGNTLIFLGLNGSAFYNSYGKKVLRRYSPMEMLFCTYLAMFMVMTPLTLWAEWDVFARVHQFTLQTWIGLVLLTVFHNLLSMVLFLKALHHLDAIQAGLCNYLITFFGIPIAAIWLGEALTPYMVLGGTLVLGSTLLITVLEEKLMKDRPPA